MKLSNVRGYRMLSIYSWGGLARLRNQFRRAGCRFIVLTEDVHFAQCVMQEYFVGFTCADRLVQQLHFNRVRLPLPKMPSWQSSPQNPSGRLVIIWINHSPKRLSPSALTPTTVLPMSILSRLCTQVRIGPPLPNKVRATVTLDLLRRLDLDR